MYISSYYVIFFIHNLYFIFLETSLWPMPTKTRVRRERGCLTRDTWWPSWPFFSSPTGSQWSSSWCTATPTCPGVGQREEIYPGYNSVMVHSHWSRNVEARLSLVERIIVLLRQPSYAIKNQLGQRVFACSSLVLYGIRDRWLPCTERSYYRRPDAITNQLRASKMPPIN